MARMYYQGHGSYRLATDAGTVIYIDPCCGDGYDLPADIVIVTHEHPDHNQVNRVIQKEDCVILRAADFQPEPGDYRSFFIPEEGGKGVRMAGVQAYNKNHASEECVGVIIELDDVVFYASGDTSTTEDMSSGRLKDLMIDYATFPGDGFFNMDIAEASACAEMVDAIHSIPIHLVSSFDIKEMVMFSRERAEEFTGPGRTIVEPGETLELVPAGK